MAKIHVATPNFSCISKDTYVYTKYSSIFRPTCVSVCLDLFYFSLFSFGFSYDTRKVFALDNNSERWKHKFKPMEKEHFVVPANSSLLNNFALISLNNLIFMFRTSFFGALNFFSLTLQAVNAYLFSVFVTHKNSKSTTFRAQKLNVVNVNVFIPLFNFQGFVCNAKLYFFTIETAFIFVFYLNKKKSKWESL